MSGSGQWQAVIGPGNGAFVTSSNYGANTNPITWTPRFTGDAGNLTWTGGAFSNNGQYLTAITSTTLANLTSVPNAGIFAWNNYLINAPNTAVYTERAFAMVSVAMSSSGKYQTVVGNSLYDGSANKIYTSSNFGPSWETAYSTNESNFINVAMSATGQYQIALGNDNNNNSYTYISTDYGVTWTSRMYSGRKFTCVSVSSNGQYQTLVEDNGYIYLSYCGPATLTTLSSAFNTLTTTGPGYLQIISNSTNVSIGNVAIGTFNPPTTIFIPANMPFSTNLSSSFFAAT
jgi:hypothetical protein